MLSNRVESKQAAIEKISQAILEGKPKYAQWYVQEALDMGIAPLEILNQGMVETMRLIGERYNNEDVNIVKILSAARAMKYGLAVLKPHIGQEDGFYCGKAIIGTVEGDLHDLGKNLVVLMFETAGFEVIDLGVDVAEKKFLKTVSEHPDAVIICISALLTTTMPQMQQVVKSLNASKQRSQLKIMVGGGPITQEFADQIGADAYTDDAIEAALKARRFVV